ncbi:hypothetical protein [uncultured Algibacter sp.]|uniref:hypothetical protein n=1 Tax=uncultured Algibacter sp. TaxID=298659 RepID=UPI002631A5A1|nr:hypothetical protein [uncultured Algibacter sp.]
MKKIMLTLAVVSAISFTACSSDDDDDSENGGGTCKTCTLATISSEICDNGDGTITVTTLGVPQTVDLEGVTFSAFMSVYEEQEGVSCN